MERVERKEVFVGGRKSKSVASAGDKTGAQVHTKSCSA